MVTELIDEGRQRLLALAKRFQAVDGLLEDDHSQRGSGHRRCAASCQAHVLAVVTCYYY